VLQQVKNMGEPQAAEKMSALTAALPLPPRMKFPF
jgi:hypothetical protein